MKSLKPRGLRQKFGIGIDEAAEAMGLKPSTYKAKDLGNNPWKPKELQDFVEFINTYDKTIDISYFYEGCQNKEVSSMGMMVERYETALIEIGIHKEKIRALEERIKKFLEEDG